MKRIKVNLKILFLCCLGQAFMADVGASSLILRSSHSVVSLLGAEASTSKTLMIYSLPQDFNRGPLASELFGDPVLQKRVSGKVMDAETGLPLSGVSVRVQDTNTLSITDANGVFVLAEVPEGAVLILSLLGYQAHYVLANEAMLVSLSKSVEALQEVVVTALGLKREKRALGYAVQEIKGEELQKVKGVDVGTTLTGRISGLRVLNSTEFNRMPSISLRGMNPILVIDGVLYDNISLRDIPVDNIENINVLKGATATVLYGQRGAGGAIMISTKKGLAHKGTDIAINTNNMFFSGFLMLPKVQSSYSGGYGGKYNTDDEVWGDKLDIGRRYSQWNPITKAMEESELTAKGKANFKNFLEPGFITNNSISFTNQGERGSITTSLSHIFNKGQYPNTVLNMSNFSIAGETMLSERLNFESRFAYNRHASPNDFGAGYHAQGYIYNLLVWTGPEYDVRQFKDYWLLKDEKQNWHYNAWYDNPYLSAYEKLMAESINKLNAALTVNYQLNDWAKLVLRTGYDFYANTKEQRNPKGIYGTRGGFSGFDSRGKYWTGKYDGYSTNNDLILSVQQKIKDFGIDGLLGGSIFYRRDNNLIASTVNGLAIPGFYSLRNSVGPVSSVEDKVKEMTNSLYSRLALSWRNLLFVEATGRTDWSSTLPEENRSYFYPSISSSLIVSELFAKPDWLSLLKLRASEAVTKQILKPYEINQSFVVRTNAWDGMSSATYPNSIKDFTISPTQRRLREIGMDFSFLKNRVYGDYTYYYRKEYNSIMAASISESTGFSSRLINSKEERMTKGHEISLGAIPIRNPNWEWSTLMNLSQNLNYYHRLDPEYSADALYVKTGLRTDHYVTRDWERSPDGQVIHNSSGTPIAATHAARLYGYTNPKWFWGFTNNLRFRDFAFSFSFDGRIKGLSYSSLNARLWQTGAHPDADTKERYEEVVNGNKTFVGTGVKLVSGGVTYDHYGQILTDTRVFAPNDTKVSYESYWRTANSGIRNIWDETFFKLREVSLSYSLPSKLANRVRAKSARLAVTGQNVFIWTKEYRFSDPDIGMEDLNSPSMRYVGFNINVRF